MAQNPTSGHSSYCVYGFESTLGTVSTSFPRPFGHGVKLSRSLKNNMDPIYGLGARNASANVAKKLEGTCSVEFLLGAGETAIAHGGASWLRAVLGAVPTDGGATPYTHSYAESNTLASFSISTGVELGTGDAVLNLIGCQVNSCTISAAVDEVATVKLDCMYRTETMATSGIGSQVVPTEVPLTFAQGSITVAGTSVGYVQSVELTISNNLELIWGLGSRYSTASTAKTRKYDLKMNVVFSDVTLLLEKFYGKAATVDADDLLTMNPAGVACVLTFTNGLTSSSTRSIVFTFANLHLNEHSLPLDVNEVVKEDVSGWCLSCTSIVVSNNTSADVSSP